ncbi:GNAT family N-acetyltransferase [Enterovibrio norvegicus]|uniref:GNAT family N-acetyltransferase n=1 Tax=Enterovibrio norvegicus TaxID=188144 RepID=UPI00354FC149
MEIRCAQQSDLARLIELHRQISQFHFEQAPKVFNAPSKEDKVFLHRVLNDESRWFAVAVENDQVVGFITAKSDVNETVSFMSHDPICKIQTVVVDAEHRSKGIGGALLKACREWSEGQGAVETRLEVMAFNPAAKKLYERHGFRVQSHTMSCFHD